MTPLKYIPRAVRIPIAGLITALLLATATPAGAHAIRDETPRIAVVSAFAPELAILQGELEGASPQSVNGVAFTTGTLEGRDVVLFLSGISVVNAAMSVQLALDHFAIERIVFSGIAGGVDPGLNNRRRRDRGPLGAIPGDALRPRGGRRLDDDALLRVPLRELRHDVSALGHRAPPRCRGTRNPVLVPRG